MAGCRRLWITSRWVVVRRSRFTNRARSWFTWLRRAENSCRQNRATKYDVMQWVFWQMANQGPKMGEQGHFRRASQVPKNGDQTYALLRFDNEVHRIYGVMNLGLHKKRYLAAGQYTIADMICYPWATTLQNRNIEIDEFPNVKRWLDEIAERPAVRKAMAAGPEYREDPATITPEEQSRRSKLLNHQRAQAVPKEWA